MAINEANNEGRSMTKRLYPAWKPKWSEPCPCASEKKFKDCCRRRLPGFDIGKAYFKALKDRQQERALLAARADVTQYTIWHRSHTAPVIARAGMALKLLRIDVNALGDYVGRLSALYYRLGKWNDWPAALNHLRENIQHTWWHRKITYYRAVHHLSPEGDRTEARRELAKLEPITKDESDLDILHLFVDLQFDSQSFADRIAILDRILQLGQERRNQLQYRQGKAIQYYLIGDTKTAEEQLFEVVEMVRSTEDSDPLEGHERHLFGSLLQLLGSLKRDSKLLKQSATQFQALLAEDNWTDRGKAAILGEMGDSYRYAGEWELAERTYRDGIALRGPGLHTVHLAECLLHLSGAERAASEIDTVDRTTLERREFDDFVFGYATIAISSGKKERLEAAKDLLQNLSRSEPIFNERRLKLMVSVADALAGKATANSDAPNGVVAASSFLLLQPNFLGFGINFNAIIDYLARKKPKDPPS
ncbi:YecA family protein [Mesorhizobium huakuii]|nr:SEC-C domain-containing protein [Mesorhizobium huakuii]